MHSPVHQTDASIAPKSADWATPSTTSRAASGQVVVVAHRPDRQRELSDEVARRGFQVHAVATVEDALQVIGRDACDVCLIDDADQTNGVRELATHLAAEKLPTRLVSLVSSSSEWGHEVLPSFSCDIVSRPFSAVRFGSALFAAVEQAQLSSENLRLKRQLHSRNLQDIVGHSSAIQSLRETILVAAEDDGTVLIRGEAGTGTNLVARGIHRCSKRAWRPFIRVDCSVYSAESLERQLFGSNPGDPYQIVGALESAGGGTVLLDHIDTVALPFQKTLARLLEGRQYRSPMGEMRPVNVRLIAASHADMSKLAADGHFREDLLHRLSSVTIQTPPLRLRREDISLLVEHFLNQLAVREGRPVRRITVDAMELLESYEWPRNVRELENAIERACTINVGARLTAEDVRPWLGNRDEDSGECTGMSLREMERKLIETTFTRCGGNRERTAKILKIGLRTLSGKLREYGYPPRGGPGSNITHAAAQERRAA